MATNDHAKNIYHTILQQSGISVKDINKIIISYILTCKVCGSEMTLDYKCDVICLDCNENRCDNCTPDEPCLGHEEWGYCGECGYYTPNALNYLCPKHKSANNWSWACEEESTRCLACEEGQPNQQAHMEWGGCMWEGF